MGRKKKEKRQKVKEIIFNSDELDFEQIEELIIADYPSLEKIKTTGDEKVKNLTKVTVRDCPQLKEINIIDFVDNNQLIIVNCPNLEKLACGNNKLTDLDVSKLTNLKTLACPNNLLTNINYPRNPEKLINVIVSDNNLLAQDISVFSKFVNLEILYIGSDNEEKMRENKYNRFYGNLESLKDLNKLRLLHINNTDVIGD
jgi:Leucine-rich repeat (LRR) protein